MISQGYGKSLVGQENDINEDTFFVDDYLGLYIVVDGIRGQPCGELASSITVNSIVGSIAKQNDILDAIRSGEESELAALEIVERAVLRACGDVFNTAQKDRKCAAMGSTATLVLMLGEKAVMGHVGNTRLYVCRNGRIHQLSQDHTIIAELVRGSVISEREGREHPFRGALTRSLGTQPSTIVDTLLFDLLPQDRLLLCSNGLSSTLKDPVELTRFFDLNFEEMLDPLLEHANSQDGSDDITALVIRPLREPFEELESSSFDQPVDQLFEFLSTVPLFEALSLRQLQRIYNLGTKQIFDSGKILIREGFDCPGMFIVLTGSVSFSHRGEEVRVLGPGSSAQEISLVSTRSSDGTYRAREPTGVLIIERDKFKRMTLQFPRIGLKILTRLTESLADEIARKTPLASRLTDSGMGLLNM
jgi:serine/threonine protein phosphatase PrpC